MRFTKSIVIAAIACMIPIAGHASPVKWSTTLSIDGLTFDDFTCHVHGAGLRSPYNCGAQQIGVSTITSPGVGIQFSSGFNAAPFSFDDVALTYEVKSSKPITSIGLDFDGTFWGYAISSVTESVFSGNKLVGFAKVACGAVPGVDIGCTQTDTITLNGGYTDLHVEKDIDVWGLCGLAEASIVDQTFGADAPEPSSMALIGSGLLATSLLVRRRVKLAQARKADSQA